MANTKSAKKAMRVAARRRAINKPVRTAARTYVAKALNTIQSKDLDQAPEAVKKAISALDRAAAKGVIHRNNAARRKSRLMQKLNQALASSSPA